MKEKSENRKALPKFLVTMLLSMLAGGVAGFIVAFSSIFGLDTESIAAGISRLLRAVTPWAIPVTSAAMLGGCFLLYRSAAKQYAAWGGGDEDGVTESAENRLSWVLLLSALQLLTGMFFFAAATYYELPWMLVHVGIFLLSMGLVIFTQQKAVDLTKKMNPEKKGSVYDTKFLKKWMESCDEAERQQIGQAAFHAYRTTSGVCLWIWVALTLLNMIFDIGMMPAFVVLVVMGIMQVSYTLECMRLSKNGGISKRQP